MMKPRKKKLLPARRKTYSTAAAFKRASKPAAKDTSRHCFAVFESLGDDGFFVTTFQQKILVNKNQSILFLSGDQVELRQPKKVQNNRYPAVVEVRRFSQRPTRVLGQIVEKKGKKFFSCRGSVSHQLFAIDGAIADSVDATKAVWADVVSYPTNSQKGSVQLASNCAEPPLAENYRLPVTAEPKKIANGLPALWQKLLAAQSIQPNFPVVVEPELQRVKRLFFAFVQENRLIWETYQKKQVDFLEHFQRLDLRAKPFITIDGKTAKDFDDAVYLEKQGSLQKLYVSIADVAQMVAPKTSIDQEARLRAMSVYLPGSVVPMLPFDLSNEICSLQPNTDRFTITCEITYDERLTVVSTNLYPSVIRSVAKVSYEQIESDLVHQPGSNEYAWQLKNTASLALKDRINDYLFFAQQLAKKRKQQGAVDFDFPEEEIEVNEKMEVVGVKKRFTSPARRLIEQFMLEANIAVAKFCLANHIPIFFRNHPPPTKDKLLSLEKLLLQLGLGKKKLRTQAAFNQVLDQQQQAPFVSFIKHSILRAMSRAEYATYNRGHFGLAAEAYCHFTSPIRRYPDLFLHQNLRLFWNQQKLLRTTQKLANFFSAQERSYAQIEKKANRLAAATFLENHPKTIYHAQVIFVLSKGWIVQIESPFIEGFLPMKEHASLLTAKKRGKKQKRSTKYKKGLADSLQILGKNIQVRYVQYDPIFDCLVFQVVPNSYG